MTPGVCVLVTGHDEGSRRVAADRVRSAVPGSDVTPVAVDELASVLDAARGDTAIVLDEGVEIGVRCAAAAGAIAAASAWASAQPPPAVATPWIVRAQAGFGAAARPAGGLDGVLCAPRAALRAVVPSIAPVPPPPLLHAGLAGGLTDLGLERRDDLPDAVRVGRITEAELVASLERDGIRRVQAWRGAPDRLRELLGGVDPAAPLAASLLDVLLGVGVGPARVASLDRLLGAGTRARDWWEVRVAHARWHRSGLTGRELAQVRQRIPVLMYHGFAPAGSAGSRYVVPVDAFRRHLRTLRLLRRQAITAGELAAGRDQGKLPPPRAVVITIDDGFADVAELALPELRRARMPASIYVVTGMLGGRVAWDAPGLVGRPMMGVADVRSAALAGNEIAPHTRTHPHLPLVDDERLGAEIAGSAADAGDHAPRPRTFAYPHGELDERAAAVVTALGLAAWTTRHGRSRLGDDPARGPRIEITAATTPRALALAILLDRRCRGGL